MNFTTPRAILCLWYALLVASAANVIQWQHHVRVTNTLNAEIARLQKKASIAAENQYRLEREQIIPGVGYFYGGPATITNIPYIPYEMGTTVYNNILLTNNLRGVSKILK